MKLTTKVIKYRTRNPLMSTHQISRETGVSYSWVHAILKKANLSTNPPKRNKSSRICPECNELFTSRRKFCSSECKYNYQRPVFECHYCHSKFRRLRKDVVRSIKKGSKHIFCDRKCWNRYRRVE